MLNTKEILKYNLKKTEEQNDRLAGFLVEIEKLNEILQGKVEEKTKELVSSNNDLENAMADLQNSEDEMILTEKMLALGRVAEDAASKLRVPVDLIQKNVRHSLENTPDNDPFYESLTGAKRAADRCDKIISDLAHFSSSDANLFLQELDINEIIEDSIKKAAQEITNPDIKIRKELANDLPRIITDYMELEQVFIVMIMNAGDAINEAIKNDNKKEGDILIRSSFTRNEIFVEISDTGCGIPKNIINKIFDPFFSTKKTGKRKGMGLSLSYSSIKRLGGSIEVDSTPELGTAFSIYLPVKVNGI